MLKTTSSTLIRTPNKIKLGRKGEKIAQKYLKKIGYKIIQKNYSTKKGEIDLIMRQDDTVVFIEVKTRQTDDSAPGELAVNFHKQKHITATARLFIQKYNLYDFPCRFDVVAVTLPPTGKPEIRHYQNSFVPTK